MAKAYIVGCGKIGSIYSKAFKELGIEVPAVADEVLQRAEAAAAPLGAKAYTDYRRLLDAVGAKTEGAEAVCDAVCIATPTWSHREIALAAMDLGYHVFCEKPLAETFTDAKEMVARATAAGVKLGVGFKFRFERVFTEAKRAIEERGLGKVLHFFINYFQQVPDVDWYLEEGVTIGLLVHAMDLANWFMESGSVLGRADHLFALGRRGEDQAFLEYRYEDDRRAMISGGRMRHFPQIAGNDDMVFEIICERGYLFGRRPDLLLIRDESGAVTKSIGPVNTFEKELAAFFEVLSTDGDLSVNGIDGLKAQAMIDAAFLSKKKKGALVRVNTLDFEAPSKSKHSQFGRK